MKKIISLILVGLIGLSIIPKTLVNEKHIVLESTTNVYTKEEVDNLLSTIRNNITVNTNEITNIKSELTTLQNSLKDYALKTSLNTTNSNIDNLNTVVTDHANRIEVLENSSTTNKKIIDRQDNKGAYLYFAYNKKGYGNAKGGAYWTPASYEETEITGDMKVTLRNNSNVAVKIYISIYDENGTQLKLIDSQTLAANSTLEYDTTDYKNAVGIGVGQYSTDSQCDYYIEVDEV